jgi:long-chain fatty acid transport protein
MIRSALVAATLLFASKSLASPLIDHVGAIGGNEGAQGVIAGGGPAATYFNPAMLAVADDGVLMSFALASPQIGVQLDGRAGGDVPLIVGKRGIVGADGQPIANDVVPTSWLRRGCDAGTEADECPPPGFAARPRQARGTSKRLRTYLVLGLVKKVVRDRLTIGMYGMLPLSGFVTARSYYVDEREALFSNSLHPEMYGDRLSAISLVFGGAFTVTPELSLGAGVSLGLLNSAAASTYVRDASDYNTLLLNNEVSTSVNVAPNAGVRWAPKSWIRIGGALRAPQSFVLDTEITATLPSGTQSTTTRRNVFHAMPWMVSVGAEVDVARISFAASTTYAAWSGYRDRQGDSAGFKDTLSFAVGARMTRGRVRGFVDLTYVPTAVPLQTGRTNYVDNDRVGTLLGCDFDLGLGGMRAGVQLFVHRLLPRHQTKDRVRLRDELPDDAVMADTHDPVPGAGGLQTNNPGYPGFSSNGWFSGGALTLLVPL